MDDEPIKTILGGYIDQAGKFHKQTYLSLAIPAIIPGMPFEVCFDESELRPPPEHNGKNHHFIDHTLRKHPDGTSIVEPLRWTGSVWYSCASSERVTPAKAWDMGWRYLGPAEWRPDDTWQEIADQNTAYRHRIAELETKERVLRSMLDTWVKLAAACSDQRLQTKGRRALALVSGAARSLPNVSRETPATHSEPLPAKAMRLR
jgi:hypothetical protein